MLERLILAGSLPLLVVALLAAGLGVPIPEDPVLLAGGVLAHRAANLPWWLILGILYGSAIAADCVFWLARLFGESLIVRRPFRWLITCPRLVLKEVAHLCRKGVS